MVESWSEARLPGGWLSLVLVSRSRRFLGLERAMVIPPLKLSRPLSVLLYIALIVSFLMPFG